MQRNLQQQMYELSDRSMPQRVTLALALAGSVALAWWLLLGGGLGTVGALLGLHWTAGNPSRRASLAIALTIYFIRVLFTEFLFLKRGVSWTEVFAIAPWVFCIYILLSISGGTNSAAFGAASFTGLSLFGLGSWMNSYAEYQRHRWKRRRENHGHLYTAGLFRFSRHPNYLGDLISFSGLCLLTGRWYTGSVPVLMLAGFVFVNIPALDAHLHSRYGAAFEDYAKKTHKLIPLIY